MNSVKTIQLNPSYNGYRVDDTVRSLKMSTGQFRNNHLISRTDPFLGQYCQAKDLIHSKIKILICVTMYNQDRNLIKRTLDGVWQNLSELKNRGVSEEEVLLILIQDGIMKTYQEGKGFISTVDFLGQILEEQNDSEQNPIVQRYYLVKQKIDYLKHISSQAKNMRNQVPKAYPQRTSLTVLMKYTPQQLYRPQNIDMPKLNVLLCFKHENGKKLSSHLWFFQGFAKTLNPEYCCLVDAGTKPTNLGVVNFYLAMQADPKIGGCCGFMRVERIEQQKTTNSQDVQEQKELDKRFFSQISSCSPVYIFTWFFGGIFDILYYLMIKLFNFFDLTGAQIYQYNFSHVVDKNYECFFGFTHVLPGAWSFYRYKALRERSSDDLTILQKEYFTTILQPNYSPKSLNQQVMFLAEDRMLCMALFCLQGNDYKLSFIPSAEASTDAPDSFWELILQRRRWLNSSNCAFEYVYNNYRTLINNSSQSVVTKFFYMPVLMGMSKLSQLMSYVTPGLLFYALYNTAFSFAGSFFCKQEQRLLSNVNYLNEIKFFVDNLGIQNITIPQETFKNQLELKFINNTYQFTDIKLSQLLKIPVANFTQYVKQTLSTNRIDYYKNSQSKLSVQIIPTLICLLYVILMVALIFNSSIWTINKKDIKKSLSLKAISSCLGIFQLGLQFYVQAYIIIRFLVPGQKIIPQCSSKLANKIYFLGDNRSVPFILAFALTILYYATTYIPIFLQLFVNPKVFCQLIQNKVNSLFFNALYSHVFLVYSICQIDDVSWGTKGQASSVSQKKQEYNRQKIIKVRNFISINCMIVALLIILSLLVADDSYVILGLGLIGVIPVVIKGVFAILNIIYFHLFLECKMKSIHQ